MTKSYPNWIAGEPAGGDERRPVLDPYGGESIGEVALASAADLDRAIEVAREAFVVMRRQSGREREEVLRSVSGGIGERGEELVDRMIAESGKPRRFAEEEVRRAGSIFGLAAEAAKRFGEEQVPLDVPERAEGAVALARRAPLGPVAVTASFRSPLGSVAHRVAPALATGNPVVVKAPSRAPLTSLILAEIVGRSGAPHGSLGVLHLASDLAGRLAADERVVTLGEPLARRPGGGAEMIVHRDAEWEWSLERGAVTGFAHAGQMTVGLHTIHVDDVVADDWIPAFVDRVYGLRMGEPDDPGTVVGPLIDDEAADRVERWLAGARERGARILTGGDRQGRFVRPAVLTELDPETEGGLPSRGGPVVVVKRYLDFEEAVEKVGRSGRAIQAGVFTHDVRRIGHAFRTLEMEAVTVNDIPTFRVRSLRVRSAMRAMTAPRVLILDTAH
ncbi:MAG: aldehyde dehydrogenase family protein [Gemmatimonadota bacterium]|nr:aldehyde dehydrogenase family protein [Gemmatimonadota bacterium]